MRFSTKAIHVGQEPDPRTGAVTVPIYMTSTYSQKAQKEWQYGRTGNPTRAALETNLAALEEGTHGLCFGSGMGGITTAMTLLKKGDHAVVSDDCYGGVFRIFTRIMSQYGIDATFVDMTDLVSVEDAMRPETRILSTHSKVAKVLYPGLPSHPGFSIAKRQMRRPGGMLSFLLKDPSRAMDFLKRLEVLTLAESLGGVETLIEHPASMTHASLPPREREVRGISDALVRLSVGIEDAEDLIEDLGRALG